MNYLNIFNKCSISKKYLQKGFFYNFQLTSAANSKIYLTERHVSNDYRIKKRRITGKNKLYLGYYGYSESFRIFWDFYEFLLITEKKLSKRYYQEKHLIKQTVANTGLLDPIDMEVLQWTILIPCSKFISMCFLVTNKGTSRPKNGKWNILTGPIIVACQWNTEKKTINNLIHKLNLILFLHYLCSTVVI